MAIMNLIGFAAVICVLVNYANADGVTSFEKVMSSLTNVCTPTSCGTEETCCTNKRKGYNCCQYKNAVCCDDQAHCCPEGTTCDSKKKGCVRHSDAMEWTAKETNKHPMMVTPTYTVERKPLETFFSEVGLKFICPNHSVCPGLQTCCLRNDGNYNCCPLPYGTCCVGGLFCCPLGRHCIGNRCY